MENDSASILFDSGFSGFAVCTESTLQHFSHTKILGVEKGAPQFQFGTGAPVRPFKQCTVYLALNSDLEFQHLAFRVFVLNDDVLNVLKRFL